MKSGANLCTLSVERKYAIKEGWINNSIEPRTQSRALHRVSALNHLRPVFEFQNGDGRNEKDFGFIQADPGDNSRVGAVASCFAQFGNDIRVGE